MGFGRKRGPHGEEECIPSSARVEITDAQAANKDAIFHGACIGCLWKKGNNHGAGLRWCMGCAFFDFSDHMPNRRLSGASDQERSAVENGYGD